MWVVLFLVFYWLTLFSLNTLRDNFLFKVFFFVDLEVFYKKFYCNDYKVGS